MYFVLDEGRLWCKAKQNESGFSWYLSLQYVKLLLPQEDESEESVEFEKKLKHGFKLAYGENSWSFWGENKSEEDKWIKTMTKFLIRTDISVRFQMIGALRTESSSKVYQGLNHDNKKPCMIYEYNKATLNTKIKDKLTLLNEITVSRTLDHPNLGTYQEVHETEKSIFIIYEVYQGGTIFQFIKEKRSLTKKDVLSVMIGLMRAVEYLEKKEITRSNLLTTTVMLKRKTHIKPEDVVLTHFCKVCLLNFSSPKKRKLNLQQEVSRTNISPDFRSPVKFTFKSQISDEDLHNNVYLAGNIMLEMMSGFQPLEEESLCSEQEETDENYLGGYQSKEKMMDSRFSSGLVGLAKQMLTRSAEKRPKSRQVLLSLVMQLKELQNDIKNSSKERDLSIGTEEFSEIGDKSELARFSIPKCLERKVPTQSKSRNVSMRSVGYKQFKNLLTLRLSREQIPACSLVGSTPPVTSERASLFRVHNLPITGLESPGVFAPKRNSVLQIRFLDRQNSNKSTTSSTFKPPLFKMNQNTRDGKLDISSRLSISISRLPPSLISSKLQNHRRVVF